LSPDGPEGRAAGAEGEFEELLRRVPGERVDPRRRAEARQAFLAAEGGAASRAGGQDRMGVVAETEEEHAFAAWLARRAALVPAAEGARRRARLVFLSELAGPPLRQRRRSPLVRALVLAGAAAAIAFVTFFLPKPEHWQVRLDGALSFSEAEYTPGEDDQLAVALEGAGRVETKGARARFSFGKLFDIELLPESSVEFPPLPELDGVLPVVFQVDRGEAYVRTGAGYPGNPIRIVTPLAEVALHGTTVGVRVDEGCVCVCVADGTAHVESPHLVGGARDVGPRWSVQVFSEGGEEGKLVAFPPDEEKGNEHTRELVEFLVGP